MSNFFTLLGNLVDNFRFGLRTGTIARAYRVEIQLAEETFGIWGTIYARLVPFSLRSHHPRLEHSFQNICRLNSQWLQDFGSENFLQATETIFELRDSLEAILPHILNPYDRETFEIYYTWVSGACVIQNAIYRLYVVTQQDDSYDDLLKFIRDFKSKKGLHSTSAEVETVKWLLRGIMTKGKLDRVRLLRLLQEADVCEQELLSKTKLGDYLQIF